MIGVLDDVHTIKTAIAIQMPLRANIPLLLTAIVIPIVMLLLGIWQGPRGADYERFLATERAQLVDTIGEMQAHPKTRDGSIDMAIQYRHNGQLYAGELALTQARDALWELDFSLAVARYRQLLPPILVVVSSAVLAIGIVVLAGASLLAGLGSRSRLLLARGFSAVRLALPIVLSVHVILCALAVVVAVVFEAAVALRLGSFSQGHIYFLGIAVLMIGAAVVTAVQALTQLRRVSSLFEPDPFELIALPVDRGEAPGLWALVDGFARRLAIAVPDTIVVGVTRGFFVISGAVRLLPSQQALRGNTLHVPLGHLALMQPDEAASIIGHELAHFAGADTVYSETFLPIYAGVGRSLDAIAAAGRARDCTLALLAQPAWRLGLFVMDRFHLAVRHWSRRREFEADATSASLTSPDAAGRAMLRHEAITGLIDAITTAAWANPAGTSDDLVATFIAQAAVQGLDDPSQQLADAIAHPTDSHPPNGERLAALHFQATPERIAAAMGLPSADDAVVLGHYFASPLGISRQLTAQLLDAAQQATAAHHQTLTAIAADVSDDVVELYENSGPVAVLMFAIGLPLLAIAGWTAIMGLPGFGPESFILVIAFGCFGLFMTWLGVNAMRQARTPFLRLYPDRIEHRHLDRPIFWTDVRDVAVGNHAGTMMTVFLLKRQTLFPKRRGGGRRAMVSPEAWTVTLRSVPPKQYKSAGYIELIERYATAAAARNALKSAPVA